MDVDMDANNEPQEDQSYLVSRQIQMQYTDFLNDMQDHGKYHERIKEMIDANGRRLMISINDLRKKYPNRATSLLNDAPSELAALQEAVKDVVRDIEPSYNKTFAEFFVGFEGSFGNKHVTPRTLTSRFLGNLVCVEGIVTRCSLAKLKVVKSVHYCPATGKFIERTYTDMTSTATDSVPSLAVYPTKDDDGNLLETEFGLSVYKDHQTLTIQEMPEKAPAGQLPRSVDVICDNDLVDACKPGDRLQVVGCFRCLPGKHGGFTSGVFRTVVIANSISLLSAETDLEIDADDISACKKLAKRSDVFELLSNSLAPSIHGHEFVKRAILCLLLGGTEKVLANGTRLRGDINILLIGDPSVAKSQLLRYVLQTAPRAVATTGRGSSGVGLTAAVTTDTETGERRLEAGAMILADRGVVCIDEFDKMSDMDRTAIHEVMEQGQVTIAKAGIHARLNARCSVLAAANPVYGRYDQYKTPMENIGMQDSLLSRFDLLFVLLDMIDPDDDGRIADHVVRMHRWRSPREQDGDVIPTDSAADMLATHGPKDEVIDVFEKYDALLHGKSRSVRDKIVSMKFMRKYILVCKSRRAPKLTEEACDAISEEYSRLRSQDTTNSDVARTQPITARTLETLIRLSTAHAKARFSLTVDVEDATAAIELVQYAIFRKVLEREKSKKRQRDGSEGEGDDNQQEPEQRPKRTRSDRDSEGEEFERADEEEEVPSLQEMRERSRAAREAAMSSDSQPSGPSITPDSQPSGPSITPERMEALTNGIVDVFMSSQRESMPVSTLTSMMKDINLEFTASELEAGFDKLSVLNKIMIADDIIFLI